MKGKIFGYVAERPCPSCGTERVGIDADDDYGIVPGRLIPRAEPVELDVRADEVRVGDVLRHHGYWLPVTRVEPHPDGVVIGFERRWDYTVKAEDALVHVRRTEQREPYEPLPGCDECSEMYSNPYALSD